MNASRIKVRVTAEHITRGEPWSYDSCPIALALADAVGAVPTTTGVAATIDLPGHRDIPIPPRVDRWVDDFDTGRPVMPFTFTLEVPA